MIHIHYDYDSHHHRLRIAGHAGYAPRGQDIVCAAVSGIAFALQEYLTELNAVEELICRTGELKLQGERCDETDVAFDVALSGWKHIQRTYPQCVEVDIPPLQEADLREQTDGKEHEHHAEQLHRNRP